MTALQRRVVSAHLLCFISDRGLSLKRQSLISFSSVNLTASNAAQIASVSAEPGAEPGKDTPVPFPIPRGGRSPAGAVQNVRVARSGGQVPEVAADPRLPGKPLLKGPRAIIPLQPWDK